MGAEAMARAIFATYRARYVFRNRAIAMLASLGAPQAGQSTSANDQAKSSSPDDQATYNAEGEQTTSNAENRRTSNAVEPANESAETQ